MPHTQLHPAHAQCAPDHFSCRTRHLEASHAALAAHQTQSLLTRAKLPGLLCKQAQIILAPVPVTESTHYSTVLAMFDAFVRVQGGGK